MSELRTVAPLKVVSFLTSWVLLLIGLLVTFVTSLWFSFEGANLGGPRLTNAEIVDQTTAPNTIWAVMTLSMAFGFAAFAGPRRWVSGVDPAAFFGVLWVAWWLTVGSAFHGVGAFADPERQCVREDCWPDNWEELAICTPAIITCLVVLLMATVGRNARRWVRAIVPAVVFIVLTIIQLLVWDAHAIPFFSGPRPW